MEIYSKLNPLKKNRFNELKRCVTHEHFSETKITMDFDLIEEVFATVKTIMPDFMISIEDLNNEFWKQENFTSFLLTVYLIRKIGNIVAKAEGCGTNDATGAIAFGLAFLGCSLDELVKYISSECDVITNNHDLLDEFWNWDNASELNGELLALGSFNQSEEKVTECYLEHKVKIDSLISLYNYYKLPEKSKAKQDITPVHQDFLKVMYTNIAYHTVNFNGGDLDEIPDFLIFRLIISDLVKIIKSDGFNQGFEHGGKVPDYIFRENGFVWDPSIFILPTKAKPVLGLDGVSFLQGDMDVKEMDYVEAYRPHLLELLEAATTDEEREHIQLILDLEDEK